MAEAIALAASIITIAETGFEVAKVLLKLAENLKHSRKDAIKISKNIQLLSKVLKQIEPKVRQDQSLADMSLIEECIFVCKGRLDVAQELIDTIQKEMSSGNAFDRIVMRTRFLFSKSKFSLLQQDMDSLQMTLNLYLTTLIYQQAVKSDDCLNERRNELFTLKQEVESDLQDRSIKTMLDATIRTMQFSQSPSATEDTQSSRSASRQDLPIVEEVEEAEEHREQNHSLVKRTNTLPEQYSSLSLRADDAIQATHITSVPMDLLEDDAVSQALVVFTQIHLVQMRTLRRAAQALDQAHDDSHGTKDTINIPEDEAAPNDMNTASTQSDPSNATSDRTRKLTPPSAVKVPSKDISPVHKPAFYNEIPALTLAQRTNIRNRQVLAGRYVDDSFSIENIKTGALLDIQFSLFVTLDLPAIIFDVYKTILVKCPPKKRTSSQGSADNTKYQTPPFPALGAPGPDDGESSLEACEDQRSKLKSNWYHEYEDYIVAYAQWYTDQLRLAALKDRKYTLYVDARSQRIGVGNWTSHLQPGDSLQVRFDTMELQESKMVQIFVGNGKYMKVARSGPYVEDLEMILSRSDRYWAEWQSLVKLR